MSKSGSSAILIFLVNDTTYAMLPHLIKKLPWDHANDLVPLTTLAQTPLILVVSATSPYKTAQELIAAARSKPGRNQASESGKAMLRRTARTNGFKCSMT